MIATVCTQDVLEQIGYRHPPAGNLLDLIHEMLDLGNTFVDPSMRFKIVEGSGDLPLFLQGAALGYLAVATIGPDLEKKVAELFDSGKATEGYLLDTVGSVAVMHAGNALWARVLKDAASKGFSQGIRRAPGCEGIPMEVQKWIVERFHDLPGGVRVTPSYMLVPRKSFAFLGRFGGTLARAFSCKGCPQFPGCSLRG